MLLILDHLSKLHMYQYLAQYGPLKTKGGLLRLPTVSTPSILIQPLKKTKTGSPLKESRSEQEKSAHQGCTTTPHCLPNKPCITELYFSILSQHADGAQISFNCLCGLYLYDAGCLSRAACALSELRLPLQMGKTTTVEY